MGNSMQYEVALRLADEGVPLRAIARATALPSLELREFLTRSLQDGRLLSMPREDWPIGYPRDERAFRLSQLTTRNPASMIVQVQQLFGCTRAEANFLLALVQNDQVSKIRDDMAYKSVDVYVCRLRKLLEPLQISINTMWGYGYRMVPKDRQRILDMILAAVQPKLNACA